MSTQPTHTPPHHGPAQQVADAHDYREILHDLILMGADLARQLRQQAAALAPNPAAAPPAPAPAPETLVSLAIAFDRTARAVRRGVMLSRILAEPPPPAPDPARHRADARKRILREVEDTIQRPGADGRGGPAPHADLQDSLHAELHDRMDAPDLDDDIAGRPAADIITEICRDLGLAAHPGTRPFKRRTPDDIRQLCARAAAATPARQSGPAHGPTPAPRPGTTPRPGPDPHRPDPVPVLVTTPRAPAPARAANGRPSGLPDDPAEAIATILRHPAGARSPWHPPPRA
jgi:hypothetical protein